MIACCHQSLPCLTRTAVKCEVPVSKHFVLYQFLDARISKHIAFGGVTTVFRPWFNNSRGTKAPGDKALFCDVKEASFS